MTLLIDARNIDEQLPALVNAIAASDFIGIDCETEDSRRHQGLNERCGYDPTTGKKSKGKPLIFDHRRNRLCGLSLYSNKFTEAVYINVGHADVWNRVSHDVVREILAAKRPEAWWIAHNAPFEITTFHNTLGWALDPKIICTLQMCVSAYGPHEVDHQRWLEIGQGGIAKLIEPLVRHSFAGLLDQKKMEMTPELSELVFKVIAKESDSEWSYNGLLKAASYGYGLKKAIKSHFDYDMTTYQQVLGDKAHMGQLTGEEVAEYGADDAFWAFKLFHHLLGYMLQTGGQELVSTFFTQENPMAAVFSRISRGGMKVNTEAVSARRDTERTEMANILRKLKPSIADLLPFPDEPDERLMKYDSWYVKGGSKYRKQVIDFAALPDDPDTFSMCAQVRGPVSNAWANDKGVAEPKGINMSHYMPVRTIMYDLIRTKALISQGKVQSDGEARGKIKDRLIKAGDEKGVAVIDGLNAISGVEQRVKLYLTPYNQLMDPESKALYPTITSMLATRRMASSEPNGMQLAKRGESTYVRGFFEADYDDHVILSVDWSGIELVEIGEFSGDPEFIKAFGQLPHEDLHAGASADILAVECPGLDEKAFKDLRHHEKWGTYAEHYNIENLDRLAHNLKGESFAPPKAYKYWRAEVGKGANFNYWYSGYLATIGERLGWSPEKTSAATRRYADRFAVAEQWRLNLIDEVARNGFITLPDHQRYVRMEATQQWAEEWRQKFLGNHIALGLENFAHIVSFMGRKIQKRAGNQSVNAYIQGSCATIAKRSILAIESKAKAMGWGDREMRFMIPIHDELLFSVRRDLVVEAIALVRGTMIDHPDLFKLCKLDASPSIGLNFEPWDAKKAPLGQVELYEPPAEIVGEELANKRLDDDGVRTVVDWLFSNRDRKIAA